MIKRSIEICKEYIANSPNGIRVGYEYEDIDVLKVVQAEANKLENQNLKVYSHQKRSEKENIVLKYFTYSHGNPHLKSLALPCQKGDDKAFSLEEYDLVTYLDIYFQ